MSKQVNKRLFIPLVLLLFLILLILPFFSVLLCKDKNDKKTNERENILDWRKKKKRKDKEKLEDNGWDFLKI